MLDSAPVAMFCHVRGKNADDRDAVAKETENLTAGVLHARWNSLELAGCAAGLA